MATLISRSSIIASPPGSGGIDRLLRNSERGANRPSSASHGGLIALYFTNVKYNIEEGRMRSFRSKFSTRAKRAEHGSHKVFSPARSPVDRPPASHERPRQAHHLCRNDRLYRQCRPTAGPPWLHDCRCLRGRRWPVAGCRLSCAGGGVRSGGVRSGNGGGLFPKFRRSESDDPFSQENHYHLRGVSNCAFFPPTPSPRRAQKGWRDGNLNIQG